MSNSYRYCLPPVPHYQVPRALDQWLTSISFEELRLLLLVQSEAERTSLSEVPLTPDVISMRTGINRSNISNARRGLVDYGLLNVRQEGRQFVYIVCDPQSGRTVPDRKSLTLIDFTHVPADVLRGYIQPLLKNYRFTKEGINGRCPLPGHNDTTASFIMDLDKGGKWWCRGCTKSGSLIDLEMCLSANAAGLMISPDKAHTVVRDKLRALGLGRSTTGKQGPTKDIVFPYIDEFGEVLTETVRRKGVKSRMLRRKPHPEKLGRYIYDTEGCRNILYNLPQVIEARTVLICEGEPDCDTVTKLALKDDLGDFIAVTTNALGAGNFLPDHAHTLRNKRVILCGDNDIDGRGLRHMLSVKESLAAAGVKEMIHVELPAQYRDVSHFLETQRPKRFADLVGPEWLEPIEDDTVEI